MRRRGYIKTVEAIIAAGMIFVFSTMLLTNPMGIARKTNVSELKAQSTDVLRVLDQAIYDGDRTYMDYYLGSSTFPPSEGDPMLKALYDAVGQGLPHNVRYKLIVEGTNSLGEGATISLGPEPQASNVVTSSYLKTMAGFLSASQFPPIGVLAAVDDQYDVEFLCATVGRAQELYPDIQIKFTIVNEGTTILTNCDGTPLPVQNWNDFMDQMTGDYFVYLFEDIQYGPIPPGLTWEKYLDDIQCVGSQPERKKGIIFGASTLYYIWEKNTGWGGRGVAQILALNPNKRAQSIVNCNSINQTLIHKVPSIPTSTTPTDPENTFVKNFNISQYHFITRDFLKGDLLRYNDLWQDSNGNSIFRPATRPSYWPTVDTGDGCVDDFWCRGLFSTYVSYDVSKDQADREVWYELATHNDIEGIWDPDKLLPLSPTPCAGYNFNENKAAILKQVMPEGADACAKDNLCGRYAINLLRLGRAWKMYMLYYENWGQIREPDAGGNGTINTIRLSDDEWDSGLACYTTPPCGLGSTVDAGAIIIQPGPDGILQSLPGGDDQEVRDTDALYAAKDLETLMFEEIVWASFWDTPFEYRVYKIILITWYAGGAQEILAYDRRWYL